MSLPIVEEPKFYPHGAELIRTRCAVVGAFFLTFLPPHVLQFVLQLIVKGSRSSPSANVVARVRAQVCAVSAHCAGQGCLQRSVAVVLVCRLHHHGAVPVWKAGYRVAPFAAHAWVETDNCPIGEPEYVKDYISVLEVHPESPMHKSSEGNNVMIRAEMMKLVSLRAPVIVAVVTALGTALSTWWITYAVKYTLENGRAEDLNGVIDSSTAIWMILDYANIGIILFGSWIMYEEQGVGNMRTTLLSVPNRASLLWAKTVTALVGSLLIAIVAVFGSYASRRLVIGNIPLRADGVSDIQLLFGIISYWTLLGTLTFAFSVVVRNGLIGMGVMLMLTLAVSQYLYKITEFARFLPDQAGMRLYQPYVDGELGPISGFVVLCTWVIAALIGGVISMNRWAVR